MINALQSAGNLILLTLINKFLSLACSPNYYLSGMESVHKNSLEDRIWKFRCCCLSKHVTSNCGLTGYINNRYHAFNYMVGQSWTWKSCRWYSNDTAMQTKFLFLQVPFLNDQFFKVVLFINCRGVATLVNIHLEPHN